MNRLSEDLPNPCLNCKALMPVFLHFCRKCGAPTRDGLRFHPGGPIKIKSRGIPRGRFVFNMVFCAPFFSAGISEIFKHGFNGIGGFGLFISGLAALAIALLALGRFQNMGMSGWKGLTILIPVYNLAPLIQCLICQRGYAYRNDLDTTGKILALILGGVSIFATLVTLSLAGK